MFTSDVMRAIPQWVRQGADRRDIAEALGTTVQSLNDACSRRRVSLNPLAYSGGPGSLAADLRRGLGQAAWGVLKREARARRIPTTQLVLDMLRLIARDGMVAAVLDVDDGDDDASGS